MSEKTIVKTVRVGPGFLTLLGLLFIGLKLGGVIAWSWWLVLLPLYGGLIVAAVMLVLALMMAFIAGMLTR